MITEFSNEVIDKLKHYVYRLVDPRNGQTFYVGEGRGNRVFAHANAVNMDFYISDATTEQDSKTEDNEDPAKIRKIMEIKSKGLQVIHIIQRWGMDQKTAFEVEAAFIDFFGLQSLTNLVKGHDSDRGMRWTDELETEFTAEVFDESKTPPFILIKIKDYWINQNGGDNSDSIYHTVRGHWKINPNKANKYPYVLAVRHGIVIGVYQIDTNGWKQSDGIRAYFDGKEASEEVKRLFLGKRIPDKYRRRQNPVSYSD